MSRYEATTVDQVPPGEMLSVMLGSTQVMITNVNGQFYAMDDLCPHLAVPLSQGVLNATCVTCPGHGSEFDLKTGEVIKWVGKKPGFLGRILTGEAKKPTCYPIQVEGDRIYVEI
jgi:nitrite reductase/ring-hydroxylating ferredoxin subunit